MNFLDLVIIAILLLGGLAGYRKGLIGALIGVAASLVSLVIAFSTYKALTPVLMERFGVGRLVSEALKSTMVLPAVKAQAIQGNPLDQLAFLTNILPKPLQQEFDSLFAGMMNSAVSSSVKTIGDAVVQYFTTAVVSMIAFSLIFFVSKWLLGVLGKTITRILDRGLTGSLNHTGGFVAGLAAAIILLSIALGILTPLLALDVGPGTVKTMSQLAHNSMLTPLLQKVFVGLTHSLSGIRT